jgi:hypothetical protein
MIGEAAHIHGAAPKSRRSLASMSPEERSDIANAIWLCATHARLIDRDDMTYPADLLRTMKREHEASCAEKQRNAIATGESVLDLIAIGPDIVFIGEFLSLDNAACRFRLRNFVDGGIHTMIAFIERYEQTAAIDRYVLVNSLGDGRALKDAPSLIKEKTGGYIVQCPMLPSADRIRAADLPTDLALSDNHDLMAIGGMIAGASGLEALPQLIKTCLSHQMGESPFHPDSGTRFGEYYRLLRGSPWFERFLKLEIIRQAAIPYTDSILNQQNTPLQCVERVFGIEILASAPIKNWLPVRLDLDVKGIGRWQHELSIYIPQDQDVQRAT